MSAMGDEKPVLMLPAARWWAAQGVPVLPLHHPTLTSSLTWMCSCRKTDCHSPAKHPLGDLAPNGLKDATTDQDTITRWWTKYPEANIGLRTGVVFDLLDIDGPDGETALAALTSELGGEPESMCKVRSGRPNGGRHYYCTPPGLGSFSGGRKNVPKGLDCKSTDGYVVAPPSVHITGQRYEWIEPWGTITGTVTWTVVHAHLVNIPVENEPFTGPAILPTPGNAFADAVLNRLLDEMHSAIEGNRWQTLACDVLFDAARAVAGGTLDRHVVLTAIRPVALGAGLARSEIDRIPRLLDEAIVKVAQPITPRGQVAPPRAAVTMPAAEKVDEITWRTPDPLVDELPEFPMWTLGPLEKAALALAEEMQTPPDLVGMFMLAALAATVRGRVRVMITDTWWEPLNLYVAVVLSSGETKSPAVARIAQPLRDLESDMQAVARPQVSAAEQQRRMQERRLRHAEERAVKAVGADRLVAEDDARQAREELDNMTVPPLPRLLVGDITPEGLVRVLADQGGALASLTTEGGLFDTFAGGRYSGGLANLDAILQAHDGREPILVDRKNGDPIRVERPCLTLGLAVQPQVIETIGGNDAARGRGFLARWLYAVPKSRVGTRSVERTLTPANGFVDFVDVIGAFDDFLRRSSVGLVRTASTHLDGTTPQVNSPLGSSVDFVDGRYKDDLKLSSSSIDLHMAYRHDLEARRHPETGDLAGITAWANKLDGQIARLAALLCLLDLAHSHMQSLRHIQSLRHVPTKLTQLPGHGESVDSVDVQVADDHMIKACSLADYLIVHAQYAHVLMSPNEGPSATARQLLGWLRKQHATEFSIREAHSALRGRVVFRKAEIVHHAAHLLVEKGYLVPAAPEAGKPGRPPSPRFYVNPAIHAGWLS